MHFGYIDGIYLKYAGKNYSELNKEKIRTYTQFLLYFELGISLVIMSLSFLFVNSHYFYISFFLSVNVLFTNVVSYFELISQATMQFKRTTIRNLIRCFLNITSVVILYLLYRYNSLIIYNNLYIIITLSIQFILAIWYIFSYRDIVFGKKESFATEKENILFFFKTGLPLLLANLIGQLVFVIDQQFVNLTFENDIYSIYAFAYNLISLITVVTSAISTVLYPLLKGISKDSIINLYPKLNSYLLIFVAFCLSFYCPISLIIIKFLPDYVSSLNAFYIILPGVMLSSNISVIKYNCYKMFDKIKNYLIKSVFILCIAIIFDLVAYLIFRNTIAISIVSIIVLLIWYIVVEFYFIKEYKVAWFKNLIYILFIIAIFYSCFSIPTIYLALIIYLMIFLLITVVFYHNEIKEIFIRQEKRY